jgi:hypothetical protein
MSRTDKDAPYWVRTEFYEAEHDWMCPDRIARSWQHYRRTPNSCTLPAEPTRRHPAHRRSPRTISEIPECTWLPVWPRRWRYNYTRPPSRKDRHFNWWGPDRANARDVLIKARQQYNGCGDVDDVIEPTAKTLHAPYCGGWWD